MFLVLPLLLPPPQNTIHDIHTSPVLFKMRYFSVILALVNAATAIDVGLHQRPNCDGYWVGCINLNPNVGTQPSVLVVTFVLFLLI
jgi:hypothetical protein